MREVLDIKDLQALLEDTSDTLKAHNLDICDSGDYMKIINESQEWTPNNSKASRGNVFDTYIESLCQGLNEDTKPTFKSLAKNIAGDLLENLSESNMNNSVTFTSPQAKLALPLFRFMWPRMVMKEMVTTTTMDSPEMVRFFFRPYLKRKDGSEVSLPYTTSPLGLGEAIGDYNTPMEIASPGTHTILSTLGFSSEYHLDKKLVILSWEAIDSTGATITGDLNGITVDEEGKFSFPIILEPGTPAEMRDVVSGYVDFVDGIIHVSSERARETNSRVTKIGFVGAATSSEENLAARIGFREQKIRFNVRDMQLQAEWSVQFEQDRITSFLSR